MTRTLLIVLSAAALSVGGVSVQASANTTPGDAPATAAPAAATQDVTPPSSDAPLPGTPAATPPNSTTPGTITPTPATAAPSRSDSSIGDSSRPKSKNAGRANESQGNREATSDERADGPAPQEITGTPDVDTTIAGPGPVAIGIPNFFIEQFEIPPFLLPIYQAAGIEYGIRWELLAAINKVETNYGRNLNVSSAGALGWMQFMPATWEAYGVDANRDGKRDPYNPVDAIFSAARYLAASGASTDLYKAIFAYNRADWYVQLVLTHARVIVGMPADLVGSLSGLTQGLFPVHATVTYSGAVNAKKASKRVSLGSNAAVPVDAEENRRQIRIYAKPGAPVTAIQDGTIVGLGVNERLGRFVRLRDAYGNTYTYGHLKAVSPTIAVAKPSAGQSAREIAAELSLRKADPKPTSAASTTTKKRRKASDSTQDTVAATEAPVTEPIPAQPIDTKQRLFANPRRPGAYVAGGREQILGDTSSLPTDATFRRYFTVNYGLKRDDVVLKSLVVGRRVIAGTILGRIGTSDVVPADPRDAKPHLLFEIRPAGRGAPRIDPKPILDGWKLLESTAIYRAKGKNPFFGPDAKQATIGQILLMDKPSLQRRVLSNPQIDIYSDGRRDIASGVIDRRVLATLEYLAASGLKPTVTSLKTGHGLYTSSGNISHHVTGNAVDIAAINGIPMLGNQGADSITDIAVRRLLALQGTMKPSQIITLMRYEGTDNTVAMADHHDHIHVGFNPEYDPRSRTGRQLEVLLKPGQWSKLIKRLNEIKNPEIPTEPSKYALSVTPPTGSADGK